MTKIASTPYWLASINSFPCCPPATLPSKAEVIIIGGGIMGISSAYWLARRGIDTLVLEAEWFGWGATGRNAGLMLAGTSPLEDPQLLHRVLREEQIQAGYAEPGHLALASSSQIWERICTEVSRRPATAAPLYALDRSSCEELLHMRIASTIYGGRWLPKGGVIDPVRLLYGLAAAATRYGACLVPHTRVSGVSRPAGQDWTVVHTSRGDVQARQVIYACSSGIIQLLPAFRELITTIRGQVLATYPLPLMFNFGLAIDWGAAYWRQTSDGVIILGGCRNHDPEREVSDEEVINPRVQAALEQLLPSVFPDFPPARVAHRWAGIMTCSLDSQLIVGPLPQLPHHWIIAGFCGHGLPLALGTGKAVAEGVVSGIAPIVLDRFNAGRFGKPIVHREPAAVAHD